VLYVPAGHEDSKMEGVSLYKNDRRIPAYLPVSLGMCALDIEIDFLVRGRVETACDKI